ncbi:hypothetical protein [Flavobacterium sp.]|uniref:hypothetical protein n=1 Tax=Flavobacterium sp. TaxID=239 RepID=UPI004033ECF8
MKKTVINNIYKPVLLVLLMLMPVIAVAQDEDTEFEDDVDDEVAMPINGYVAASLLGGCAMGYVLLKRGQKVS